MGFERDSQSLNDVRSGYCDFSDPEAQRAAEYRKFYLAKGDDRYAFASLPFVVKRKLKMLIDAKLMLS